MTDSLCRKRKLADSFIPCEYTNNGLTVSNSDFCYLCDVAVAIFKNFNFTFRHSSIYETY